MPETIVDDLKINYEDLGEGEPALLLMPDWCMTRAVFGQLALKCATHRRVLALDWRGYGKSETPADDYGTDDLLSDALAVIETSGAQQVVPVTISHSGWVAIELRRKLGERISQLVFLDWPVLPPPPTYKKFMEALVEPDRWQQTRDKLFEIWLEGVDNPDVIDFVLKEMGSYNSQVWMRAGREIGASYAQWGSPLEALTSLKPPVPVLHLYAQLNDLEFLSAQESFSTTHFWFSESRLKAKSHFPTLEVPDEIEAAIENYLSSS